MPADGQNVIIEDRGGYLYVEYSGNPVTLDMLVQTINKAAAAIREQGCKNVLVARNAPLLDNDTLRTLVGSMIRNLVKPDVRFALVDIFGNDPEAVRHAAIASNAAGWNVTGFDTTDEAIAWLTA